MKWKKSNEEDPTKTDWYSIKTHCKRGSYYWKNSDPEMPNFYGWYKGNCALPEFQVTCCKCSPFEWLDEDKDE